MKRTHIHVMTTFAAVLALVAGLTFRVAGQSPMPDVVCVGATKHYWVTPNPVAGSTYTWVINGVVQSSTTNEIYVTWDLPYTPAGSPYTITVREKNAAGCFGEVKSGLVYLNEAGPVAVTITPSQDSVCEGMPVTYTALAVNGGFAPAYAWTVNGSPSGTGASNLTYIPADGDLVVCQVTSNAACATNNPALSEPDTMKVLPAPAVAFTPCFDVVTSTEARPFRLKGGYPPNGNYSGGAWVNNPVPGWFNPQAAPTGLVPVSYSFSGANGCTDSATAVVRNVPAPATWHCGQPWLDVRDSLTYPTVAIASPGSGQCWLAANLNRGVQISSLSAQTDNCVNEKYCYQDVAGNCTSTGALYQWDELMKYETAEGSQGMCPPGWHVPAAPEWMTLIDYFGGNSLAADKLKDPALGFNVVPGGVLYLNQTWSFKGLATLIWTSTPAGTGRAVSRGLNTVDSSVSYYESLRNNAFPVRCIRN